MCVCVCVCVCVCSGSKANQAKESASREAWHALASCMCARVNMCAGGWGPLVERLELAGRDA